jgi:hypothetical protein
MLLIDINQPLMNNGICMIKYLFSTLKKKIINGKRVEINSVSCL